MLIPAECLLMALTAALTLCSAVLAGVFFAFSNFVMGALDKIDRASRVQAMLSINAEVLNRTFLALFFGSAGLSVLQVLSLPLRLRADQSALWLGAGAALSLAGFLITAFKNVPLNQRLLREAQSDESPEACWRGYFQAWTFWNHLRCAAYMGSAVFLLMGSGV